jgi:hypothetical protein
MRPFDPVIGAAIGILITFYIYRYEKLFREASKHEAEIK